MSFTQNNTISRFRIAFLVSLAMLFFIINILFRLSLHAFFPTQVPFSGAILSGLGYGFINDIWALLFVLILPVILLYLPSDGFFKSIIGKAYSFIILFIFSIIFIFNAFSEYFFWEEFSSRFNFIAVDYLVYTTEVIQNIVESYPLFWLLLTVFILSLLVTLFIWRKLKNILDENYLTKRTGFLRRFATVICYCLIATASYFACSPLMPSENRYWNEYAKNGVYELFSAFLHNQLDYRKFYKTIDSDLAFDIVQKDLGITTIQKGTNYRTVTSQNQEIKPNIILVVIESLGRNKEEEQLINLRELGKESLRFTNMSSTGTRTVRGLEAIMLSIPPTPGNSIVRRPDNHDLYSLATPFKDRGYDLDFIYGGVGFFDNMNDFFSGIGFNCTDKLSFASENKTFSNAWGQCDGDSYKESIRLADISYQNDKPFMQVILTTSNHRPFTFPENTIDLPQGSRKSAIRYTDYAIGEFVKEAKTKAWFDNTIFIFIADHPSSVAGRTNVPHMAYGIESMIYSPKYIKPGIIDTLCSQIDLAPTLLNLIGISYTSDFFGKDILAMKKEEGRAFVSTYQLLGYVDSNYLAVLSPNSHVELTKLQKEMIDDSTKEQKFIEKTIAYYQTAYDMFTQKLLKEAKVKAYKASE